MKSIVTTKIEEARRSLLALFGGKARTIEIAGACYTGIVHSVYKVESSDAPAWCVKLIMLKRTSWTNAAMLGPTHKEAVSV